MKLVRSPFRQRKAVFCILASFAVILQFQNDIRAQSFDRDALVKEIESHEDARDNLLTGLGCTITRTQIVDGETKSSQVSRYDMLKKNVLRESGKNQNSEMVRMRNDGLGFDASKDGSDFEYGAVKNGLKKDQSLRKTNKSTGNVLGNLLHEFLRAKERDISPINSLGTQNGRRVEGVRIRCDTGGVVSTGEIHWLPDHHYLITKSFHQLQASETDELILLEDVTIEYEDFDGKIYPAKTVRHGNKSQLIFEISDVGVANPDEQFYTPESIGLETPATPRSNWWIYVVGAVLSLSLAFVFWRRTQS